jgi:superfamily II DNA or RNA helicase
MGVKQRRVVSETVESIGDGEPRVLLATGRYIGEGFDDARLDTLFLTLPVSWRGTIQQYAGRLHRLHASKQMVQIFDYVDANVPMLLRMHQKRLKGYRDIGYSIGDSGHETQDFLPTESMTTGPHEQQRDGDARFRLT